MIKGLIQSPISRIIKNPIGNFPLTGKFIVTTDNKILVTTDNKIGITRK